MKMNISTTVPLSPPSAPLCPATAFRGFERDVTKIGTGLLGGKAECLAAVSQAVHTAAMRPPHIAEQICVPHLYVIATDFFDAFMAQNGLCCDTLSGMSDEEISLKFARTTLPGRLIGKLSALLERVKVPIVVRSSGLLETSLYHGGNTPYSARILPNSNAETILRLEELKRAVKAVWASLFFERAQSFLARRGKNIKEEKMAIIIQEVFGRKAGNLFFPDLSGKVISANKKAGYQAERSAAVEADWGLNRTDSTDAACVSEGSSLGYWAVNLDTAHREDDITATQCCLISMPDFESSRTAHASMLSKVPTDTLLSIGERIVGGPVEIHFAVKAQCNENAPSQTAVLKVSPASKR
jgi:hypothetical protein